MLGVKGQGTTTMLVVVLVRDCFLLDIKPLHSVTLFLPQTVYHII